MAKNDGIITLPFNFTPRDYQLPGLEAMDLGGKKRGVFVWHRRAGKDSTWLNFMSKKMYERVGAYYYLFPSYSQGKKVIWNGMNRDGFKFTDYIPKALRKRTNNSEMIIEMENDSLFQVVGTDNMNSIVGTNPVGCIFSEYSLQDPAAWDYIRPILAENGGWAVFVYTPRGKNHGFDLLETAEAFPDQWYSEVLTVDDTGAINAEVLAQERKEIIKKDGNDAFYQQEYMCSFEVPIQGAYYAHQMMQAEEEGRICSVPYDENALVHTYWDLGVDDSTTIWFVQTVGREIHLIDYYENSGEGINHYIKKLKSKSYIYGDHWAPHDIKVRVLTQEAKTRQEIAKSLGIDFEIVANISKEDGRDAVRNIMSQCWFDKVKCSRGIQALRSYHKKWDELHQCWGKEVHDWSSHGADGFRMMGVGYRKEQQSQGAVENDTSFDPY